MILLRLLAVVVAALGVLPLWRMLPGRGTGLAGLATADAASSYSSLLWSGVLLALIPAVLAALLLDADRAERWLSRIAGPLARIPARRWALLCALVAVSLAAVVAIGVLAGQPTLIDSFAQLTHARYFAAGRLSGPVIDGQEFWQIQQTIVTRNGWVSQYPPGYVALLALGLRIHAVEWVGPILFGVAVFFTALVADEVFEHRALGRIAALLAAVSPFMLGMAGAYMSHVPACAFSVATLYFVLRARRGSWRWALAAGVNIGVLFTVRPLTGLVAALVAILYAITSDLDLRVKTLHTAAAALAAAPFVILIAWYNAHFFGSATTFGYTAALGPQGGLGFGIDPWGNRFGPLQSLAYTSAELSALNVFLLEIPLPIVLFIGLYFATAPARALARPPVLVFAWVGALLLANFFYWHHGLFMGPRMLADVGTLWGLLAILAVAGLIGRIRSEWKIAHKYSVRAFALGGVIVPALVGICALAPARLLSYAPSKAALERLRAPSLHGPALVFVHGGWTARIGMRLAAHGMRLDSVETALRQNRTCAVHHYAAAYAPRTHPPAALDFAPRAGRLPRAVEISPGNRIRVENGEVMDSACVAEIAADRAGVVDVTPFVWQGDLPGLAPSGPLYVRDLGPVANAQLIASQPGRVPLMLLDNNGRLALEIYAAGLQARWGVMP